MRQKFKAKSRTKLLQIPKKQVSVEEEARPIASAIGKIAVSHRILPMFNSDPKKTVYGIASLLKMARGMPLGKTESEIEAAKDAARAIAARCSMGVDSVHLLPTLKEIGIKTLQVLILDDSSLDALQIAAALGIPMPKKTVDETVVKPKAITTAVAISKTQEVQRSKPSVRVKKNNELKMWVIGAVVLIVLGSTSKIFRNLLFCTLCVWIVISVLWLFLIPTAWLAKKFPDTAENVLEVIKFVIGAIVVVIIIMFIMQLI
jgi:hypothetical protein